MNDPFDGVYQIKRSSAASYLLQIKWLVANQPWGKDIMFDTRAAFVPEFDADLVEVTSNDNRKSLASTIEEMERAENAIAATALNADTFEQEKVTLNGAYDVRVNSQPPVMTVVTIPPSSDTFEEGRAPVNGAHVSSVSTQISKETSVTSSPAANSEVVNVKIKSMFNAPMSLDQNKRVERDSSNKISLMGSTSNATHSEAKNGDLHTPKQEVKDILKSSSIKVQNAKDFLPNYFRTLSGFDEDENSTDMPSVPVPVHTTQSKQLTSESSAVTNRDAKMKMTSAYFRSVGGFIH